MPPFHVCLLAVSSLQGLIMAAHEGLEGRPFHVAETASAVLAVFQQVDATLAAENSRVPTPQLGQGTPGEDDLRCAADAGDGWLRWKPDLRDPDSDSPEDRQDRREQGPLSCSDYTIRRVLIVPPSEHRKPDLRAPDSDSTEDHRDRRKQGPLNCSDYTIRRMLFLPPSELHHRRMTRACCHLGGTLDMLSPACSLGPRMLVWMGMMLHAQDQAPGASRLHDPPHQERPDRKGLHRRQRGGG